ncbi:thioredoxin, mitochondrial-like [Schistocerca piceifrons]|uniref:thioredoxin, mitochondrial-like n=1 Tax=Schistocerca piceifrons TaxID=274613 RepID=UPI001F5F73BE|nr:thioredoxin, mitochondrial-like [Schistocerca piceifrons]XP_049957975.1 thioredoxin, mitochondrial-like [Schistocerca serialis cubense]
MSRPFFSKCCSLLREVHKHSHAATQETIKRSVSFTVKNLTEFNEKVKNSKQPVIVDFCATWCKPCEKLTPRIESVIAEKKGKILLAKVDVDENTDLAMDYEVGSIPSLIAIENGKVKERLDGLQNTEKLRSFVDKICKTEKADE